MDILPYHCMFPMAFQSDSCSRLREDVSLLDLHFCNDSTTQVLCNILERYGTAVATSTPNCSRTSHNRAVDDSGISDSFVCDSDQLNLSDLHLTDDNLIPLPKMCLSSQFDEVDDDKWTDCCYLVSDQPVKSVCGFGESDSIRSDDSFDSSAVEDSVDINISLLFVADNGSNASANNRLHSSRRPRSPAPRMERRSRHRLSLELYRESHSELGIFSESESVFADDSVSDLQQLSCLTDSGISVSQDGSLSSTYNSVDDFIQYSLNNFAPPQLDQLIGRKMGLQSVDIIAELLDRSMCLVTSNIFRCLSAAELCSVCMVSRVWQSAVESNTRAVARRDRHASQHQKKLDSSEQNSEASNAAVEQNRRVSSASVSSPLADIHSQLNCVEIPVVTKSRECSKTERFWQEARNLQNSERLLKCPRCSGPSRVDSVQERAVCASSNCQHDFCINCLSNFHGSRNCASAKLSITARRSFPLVGSRQSHQNLRRL